MGRLRRPRPLRLPRRRRCACAAANDDDHAADDDFDDFDDVDDVGALSDRAAPHTLCLLFCAAPREAPHALLPRSAPSRPLASLVALGALPLWWAALGGLGLGCDPPIASIDSTFVDVAVPLPDVAAPEGAPAPRASIAIPGFLGDTPLAVNDGVGRARFALAVQEDTPVVVELRVSGTLARDDRFAPTLSYGEAPLTLAPGRELALTTASFSDVPAPGRLWLDLNRNGSSNLRRSASPPRRCSSTTATRP